MDRGYFKLWRKWFDEDSVVWANDSLIRIMVWCLKKASHKKRIVPFKTGKGNIEVMLEPGQLIYGRNKSAKQLLMHPETARKRINKLVSLGYITIQSTTQYSIITVNDYKEMYNNQPAKITTESTKQVPSKYQASTTKKTLNTSDTLKKEPKTLMSKVKELFDLWNQYAVNGPKKANKLTQSRIAKIKDRLKEEPDINYWLGIFSKLQKLPFYCGNGNRGWRVGIDWIIKNDKNHVTISEEVISTDNPNMDYAEQEYQKLKKERRGDHET